MKPIATIDVQRKLRQSLTEWLSYLDDSNNKKTSKISSFNTTYTSTSIPNITQIKNVLGDVPNIELVLDTKGKYRRKRNDIAHRGETFTEKSYFEYKNAIEIAISELKERLEYLKNT